MKLSEAILLGSTVLSSQGGRQYSSATESGCALGMATIAAGGKYTATTRPCAEEDRRTRGAENVWGSWVLRSIERPCNCWRFRVPREMRIKDIIAHLFDHHVMAKKNWTLERLAAWVQTVEPAKDEATIIWEAIERARPRHFAQERVRMENPRERQEARDWQECTSAFLDKYQSGRQKRLRPAARNAEDKSL